MLQVGRHWRRAIRLLISRQSERGVPAGMTIKAQASQVRKKSRVFVVDDHPIVRQGLTMMINREPDMLVCGEAEESLSALQAVPALLPDVLIVDISLNGPDGID